MRGIRWPVLCFALLSLLTGCGESAKDAVGSHHHVARTTGGAVVLSYDERIAVATNRADGFVTVFGLKPERGPEGAVVKTTVLDVGEGSEPWAAVIGADDDTAYVILRKAQKLIRIDHLRDTPSVAADSLVLGSEPTGIAITPTGKLVFVSNWAEGTISTITTDQFGRGPFLDVNASLQDTGSLGDIPSRPGLAHPRALAVTDDGDQDDNDETLYATEFFAQPLQPFKNEPAAVDSNHQGFVYPIAVETGQVGDAIAISPITATGFADSNGKMTSCFPNQLSAAAAQDNRLYVTSMCTSPQGPLDKQGDSTANFKTLFHPTVFAIDTTFDVASKTRANQELPDEARVLTQVLQAAYDDDASVAAAPVEMRMPLIPNDIVFGAPSKSGVSAYVLALGADTLFRLDYDANRQLVDIGSPQHRFVAELSSRGNAIGIAVSQHAKHPFALALSEVAQQLCVVDLTAEELAEKKPSMPDTPRAAASLDSPANLGRAAFATGLGVWSFQGAAWSSCEGCHPGGLSDGVTWYFSRGPRRTLSAANTYEKNKDEPGRRLLLWGANVDEIHDVEGIVRTVSGGVGAMLWQYPADGKPSNDCRLVYDGKAPATPKEGSTSCVGGGKRTSNLLNGLNGSLAEIVSDGAGCRTDATSCDNAQLGDWNDIDAFIRSLRVPAAPTNLDASRVTAGRKLFVAGGCASCHGGSQWTASMLFYDPSLNENGAAPSLRPDTPPPLGKLREDLYSVREDLARLNPTANNSLRADCPAGTKCATFRTPAKDASAAEQLLLLYGDPSKTPADAAADATKAAGNDQLRCALRDVGTYPALAAMAAAAGAAPSNGTAPWEVRADMTTPAQGKDGFSTPSLFGLAVGAPYFHAGNARSLEQLFDENFIGHHQSVAPAFLSQAAQRDDDVQNLIAFLLSIDDATSTEIVPPEYDFCARTP
jgi:DNA-binding beta-propeller fold protein YncE